MFDNSSKESNAVEISKGTIWLTFNQVVFMLTSYLTYVFLARYLGAALFGVYGVVISLVTVLAMVLITGTQQVVAKFISEDPQQAELIKRKALQLQLLFSGCITLLYFLFSSVIALLLHDASLTPYIQLSSLIILFHSLFSVFMGYFNGLKLFKQQALYTAIYHIVRMILTIVLVLLGYAVFGAIIAFVISSVLFFVACLVFIGFEKQPSLQQRKQLQPKIANTAVSTKRFIAFALPIMLYILVIYLLMNVDLFFVKSLSDAAVANRYTGYYTAVQTIARIPYFLVAALPVVLFPLVSSSTFTLNIAKTQYYIKRGLRYTLLLLFPLTAMLAATSQEILTLLYSAEYAAGAQALFILVLGMLFLSVFTLLTTYISSANKPKVSFYLAVLTLLFSVVLNYYLVARYSLIGAALATTIALCLGTIIAAVYIYREYKSLVVLDSFLRISYATIIVYIAAWLLQLPGYWLVVEYALLGLLYAVVLYLSNEIHGEDIVLVKRVLEIKE